MNEVCVEMESAIWSIHYVPYACPLQPQQSSKQQPPELSAWLPLITEETGEDGEEYTCNCFVEWRAHSFRMRDRQFEM